MLSTISRTNLGARLPRVINFSNYTAAITRHASLTSAIGRGIRRSQAVDRDDRRGNEARFPRRERRSEDTQYGARQYERSDKSNFNERRTHGVRQYGEKNYGKKNYERSGGLDFTARRSGPKEQQYGERKHEKSGGLGFNDRQSGSRERQHGERRPGSIRGFGEDFDQEQSPWVDNVRSPRASRFQEQSAFDADEFIRSGEFREQSPRNDRTHSPRQRRKEEKFDFNADDYIRSGDFRGLPREHQSLSQSRFQSRTRDDPFSPPGRGRPTIDEPREKESKSRAHRRTDAIPERVKENVKVPETIPYTTPASEFIYGTSAVEAALRCSRRQIYKLYLYQSMDEELSAGKVTIRKLALSKNIPVKMAFAGWSRLMDKMSAGRPHNGCILETSPLPKLPVRGLEAVPSISEEYFRTELAPQTREEAAVNGTDNRIQIHHPSPPPQDDQPRHRYPVVLLMDGIVDTGNMGAIIRSSYFLGIDAIVLAGRTSAPLSPITIKSSAGAAENMPLLSVTNEVDFIRRSKENGWRFYAADAPGPGSVYLEHLASDGGEGEAKLPMMTAPSVLMMGSEASGLSSHIKSHADAIVSIPGARHNPILGVESDPARIDSLNVSVAAAILMEKFLRTPLAVAGVAKKEKKAEREKMW